MKLLRLGGSVAFVLSLGACAAEADETPENVAGVSSNLVAPGGSFADDVTVYEDRLEIPAEGHSDVLAYKAGKVVVGGPSLKPASIGGQAEKNPYGFLRRIERVSRRGGTIVLQTSPADLTDAFTGDVELRADAQNPATGAPATALAPQAKWKGEFPKRIDIAASTLFDEHLTSGPAAYDIRVATKQGSIDFKPSIATSVELKRGKLEQLSFVADGDIRADFGVTVDVIATNATANGPSPEPQTFQKTLYTSPRMRWSQLVGVVPVWESLEAKLIVRCTVDVNAAVHSEVGFTSNAHFGAGGEYKKGEGVHGIQNGPTFDLTPTWSATAAGEVHAKCALLPEVTLYLYDLAGPKISVGPYVDGRIARRDRAPFTWTAQPGFQMNFGAKISIFGKDLVDEEITLVDEPIGRAYSGTF